MRPKTAKPKAARPEVRRSLEKEGEKQDKRTAVGRSRIEKRAANITFRPQLSYQTINTLLAQHKHLIRQSQWKFEHKEFDEKNVCEILADARVLLIHSLTLHICKRPSILKEIASIGFPKMTVLNLTGNKIVSIEPLQKTYLPHLQRLILRDNLLTSLRSLRKCNFYLEGLQFSQNQIISIEGLEQLNLASLSELWGHKNPIVLNWSLFKLQIHYPIKMKRIHFYETETFCTLPFYQAFHRHGVRYLRI